MKPYDDCVHCGGNVEEKLQRLDYRYHGQLFIIEEVPVGVCNQCGEQYLTAKTSRMLEKLVQKQDKPVTTVAVPVLKAS
jgi:YgiT-type zinc finger domain-containing protein